ncbi:hypothetical protein [Nocardia wallacei]|uniref:hypothetical protein n=1 Tax=Nocardia wallacei TaxID=480035 RepID=UPI0024558330|nr:hypothetical protein [Nocardia wallacei]
MSDLEKYDAVINGWPTTVKLTEAEARERGLTRAKPPAKGRPVANKGRTPANKSRAAADKSGDTGGDGTGDPGDGDQGADTTDAGQGD